MDDLLDELAKEIQDNYNDYDDKTESDLQAQMASRKRKKEKNVITLSSDSERDERQKKREKHSRKITVKESKVDGPKVVFNPLTKSYESNIPSLSRITTTPPSQRHNDEEDRTMPSSDQLVNELLDDVVAEDDENRILTDELSSKKRRVSRDQHHNGGSTPVRDEPLRQMVENGATSRARMSSSDANETINIKSKWGDDDDSDTEDEENKKKNKYSVHEVAGGGDDTPDDPGMLDDLYGDDVDGVDGGIDQDGFLEFYHPAIQGCRQVDDSYKFLNRVAEGTYGVVFRAEDKKSGEICALKRLKMEKEREGFPITSLREIVTLLKAKHENVINVLEICVGSTKDKIFIAMEFLEHDLKGLMETMKSKFTIGEVKTLMRQLLAGVGHLHDNWILHRDLKTSNLLLNHKGVLKIADFGLAREYGSPLADYTQVVVTLWYRCPELLLGQKRYSTHIDIWSCGCIMAEFIQGKPIFPGKTEPEQIKLIFKELGTPDDEKWPGFSELPHAKKIVWERHPYNQLRKRFKDEITKTGYDLMKG